MEEFWDTRYSEKEYAYGTEANDFLAECMNAQSSGDILCLAEGQGRNAVYLAGLGYNVTAMDMSEQGLLKATELAAKKGVTIQTVKGNLEDFDLGTDKWDRVVSIFGHLGPELRNSVHKRIINSLKKGGYYIMEAYSKQQFRNQTGGPKELAMLYSMEDLEDDFEGLLEFIIFEQVERIVKEGPYHTGKANTIQMLGRKI